MNCASFIAGGAIVRPLAPADKPAVAETFASLSADTRYMRFATPKPRLTEAELRYLVDVDHHDH